MVGGTRYVRGLERKLKLPHCVMLKESGSGVLKKWATCEEERNSIYSPDRSEPIRTSVLFKKEQDEGKTSTQILRD